ncbi:oxidoreductase [Paenibacillus sp. GCM10023252]|uniref:oxidoreductase n=1 Tax=Paenibacillus sp. GCM10023252 TaxID=3252649 RepID=UPI00361B36E6
MTGLFAVMGWKGDIMETFNYLEIKPSQRFDDLDPNQDGNKNTKFADLIIDGKSIYQILKKHDMVPSLGWGSAENQREMIDYFLLIDHHEYMYNRYPVLVCPMCGDEECGFISVQIEREGDIVIWENFKKENDSNPINLGPFYFEINNYERAIRKTFGTVGFE